MSSELALKAKKQKTDWQSDIINGRTTTVYHTWGNSQNSADRLESCVTNPLITKIYIQFALNISVSRFKSSHLCY